MKWKHIASSLILSLVIYSTSFAESNTTNSGTVSPESIERIVWTQTPIPLLLKTETERMIKFSGPVRVKPPEELDPGKLRIQSIGGTVYLKALEEFKAARMLVQKFNPSTQTFDGGQMYLIDLRSNANGSTETVQIIDKNTSQTTVSNNQKTSGEIHQLQGKLPAILKTVDMVTLVRHAAQQLYAPQRLVKNHPGIHQTKLRRMGHISLYRGGEITTTPLAVWKSGSLYVTAVKATNNMSIPVILDPRMFRGQWRSRTLQHAKISPKGHEADTTTVYLVSDRPFHESII